LSKDSTNDGKLELKKQRNECEYSELIYCGYKINDSDKNKYILLKSGKVISVEYFKVINDREIVVVAKEFLLIRDFYEFPIKSSEIKIFSCSNLSDNKIYGVESFERKLFSIMLNDSVVVFAMSKFE
jgi:hypothetical protein